MNGRLAQLVEQSVYTGKVTGSSPVSPTKQRGRERKLLASIVCTAIQDSKANAGTSSAELVA
jgi:hypothetical protein